MSQNLLVLVSVIQQMSNSQASERARTRTGLIKVQLLLSVQSGGWWFRVGEEVGQQGRGQVLRVGVASVEVKVQCGRGRWVQVVCGQEHPAGFSQQLQTNS